MYETEFYQPPAPMFEVAGENTRSGLFAYQPPTKMNKADHVRACYLPVRLKYVNHEYLTNSSIRQHFNIEIEPQNSAAASRIIKEHFHASLRQITAVIEGVLSLSLFD